MITTIFRQGEDALNSEGKIDLLLPSFLATSDIDKNLSFRAISFSSPEYSLNTYDQKYRGQSITRWAPGRESTKEVAVTFRVDKYWRVYDSILDWIRVLSDLEQGTYAYETGFSLADNAQSKILSGIGISTNPSMRGSLIISQESAAGDVFSQGWTYEGIFPKSLASVGFETTEDGTPLTVEVNFSYLKSRRGN